MSLAFLPRSLVTTTFGCGGEEAYDVELAEEEERRNVTLRNCGGDDDDCGSGRGRGSGGEEERERYGIFLF